MSFRSKAANHPARGPLRELGGLMDGEPEDQETRLVTMSSDALF